MEIRHLVLRSERRSVSLQVRRDGVVEVRCPRRMSDREVLALLEKKRNWIEKQLRLLESSREMSLFTGEELKEMAERTREQLLPRVEHYAAQMGVSFGRVTVRCQRTRWGSCSGAGNLNFNCLLSQMPPEVADYVVVHELCHRKEMNHSKRFWAEVARVMPEYEKHRRWLKANGGALISRIP